MKNVLIPIQRKKFPKFIDEVLLLFRLFFLYCFFVVVAGIRLILAQMTEEVELESYYIKI